MKLMASTESITQMPGGTHSQGMSSRMMSSMATFIILPQLAMGGWTPRPRKERPASVRMALATANVALTTDVHDARQIWRKMARRLHTHRGGRPYVVHLRDRQICPRTRRVGTVQPRMPMAIMALKTLGASSETIMMTMISQGKAITTSTRRTTIQSERAAVVAGDRAEHDRDALGDGHGDQSDVTDTRPPRSAGSRHRVRTSRCPTSARRWTFSILLQPCA